MIYGSVFSDYNYDLYIFLDNGETEIPVYDDSTEYTLRKLQVLLENNIGHKVRIVIESNTCTWFELLD